MHTQQFLSKVYTIDKKYRSMEGPASVERITLGDPAKPELLWIVGIKTEMVGEDGKTPQLPELMCHVNVDLDPARHQAMFDFSRPTAARLMTLSQGMLEARVPAGFGFPVASNEPLFLFTQVLNHNIEHPNNLKVRHRVTFEYIRDAEVTDPIKPLFNVGASGMVQLDGNPNALASMIPTATSGMSEMEQEHGASCLVGSRAPQAAASAADYTDPKGRKMTGHWIVPPGRQVNASDVTWFMNLQFDTRIHYAAFHLHPFAESLSLRDTTTGTTVIKSSAQNPNSGIGLIHVDTFASNGGVPLYKDHKYELVSVYNNTTKNNADSMASIFLGLEDPDFVHRTPTDFSKRAQAILDSNVVVVRTTAGDLKLQLQRDAMPLTSMQVSRLVYAGLFDQARVSDARTELRLTIPNSVRLVKMLQSVPERSMPIERGTVMYCMPQPGENEVSLRIIADAKAQHDIRCLGFAKLTEGMEIVDAITRAPIALSASVKGATLVQ